MTLRTTWDLRRFWDPKIHDDFLRNRPDKAIYLGINTAINALNDWCPNDEYQILDHKVGLYLGKIIFSKNKQGNLSPKFIPSNIANIANEVDKINPLWLDEINKNYVPPQTHCSMGCFTIYNANNVKTLCKNSKANITLTKEQIISYFTELHQKNTEFIQNYIDSINANHGIKAYHLNHKIYDELLKKGIIFYESMLKWQDGTTEQRNQLKIIALDYLAKSNQSNFKILLYDELFYAYLVWSLRDYTIRYYQGYLAEKNNMLFNIATYIDEIFLSRYDNWNHLFYKLRNNVSDLYHSDLSQVLKDEILASSSNGWEYGFFNVEATNYLPSDEKGHYDAEFGRPMFSFISPNQALFTKGQPITPSPLGKYCFELSDNKGVFIEFFNRIYPSISNPPKGWSKEMMKKLELKLE